MAKHHFRPSRYHNAIGTAEPCLRVADGDTIVAETVDASGLDAREVAVASRPNPMTGPFFVEGAEPGDTLAVRIAYHFMPWLEPRVSARPDLPSAPSIDVHQHEGSP